MGDPDPRDNEDVSSAQCSGYNVSRYQIFSGFRINLGIIGFAGYDLWPCRLFQINILPLPNSIQIAKLKLWSPRTWREHTKCAAECVPCIILLRLAKRDGVQRSTLCIFCVPFSILFPSFSQSVFANWVRACQAFAAQPKSAIFTVMSSRIQLQYLSPWTAGANALPSLLAYMTILLYDHLVVCHDMMPMNQSLLCQCFYDIIWILYDFLCI